MNTVKRGNIFILIFMAYSIVMSFVSQIIMLAIYGEEPPFSAMILISQFLIVGLPALIYFFTQKDTKIPVGKLSIKEIIFIILIAICISPLLSLINVLSQFFVKNNVADLMFGMVDIPLILMLLMTALTPAIVEEMLSRAIIINNYERQTVLKTILMSGFFFGMIHMNINQFLYAFILGTIMCYVVLATESIFASMIIHFIINASGTILLRLQVLVQKIAWEADGEILTSAQALEKIMESETAGGTMELVMVSIAMLMISMVTVPIAYLLIRTIVNGRGKNLKGSFKMISGEFSGRLTRHSEVVEVPVYISNMDEANTEMQPSTKEVWKNKEGELLLPEKESKFFTLPIILSTIIFLFIAILNEVLLKFME